jgi:hypothetical protein
MFTVATVKKTGGDTWLPVVTIPVALLATGCDRTVATVIDTVLILSTGWDYTVVFNGCNQRLCIRFATVKT